MRNSASAIQGLAQISLKELGMESIAPAAEISSQAVVIGGDLYFPPEGQDFAQELEKSDELHVTSDERRDDLSRASSVVPSPQSLSPESPCPEPRCPDEPMARSPDSDPASSQVPRRGQSASGGLARAGEAGRVRDLRRPHQRQSGSAAGDFERLRNSLHHAYGRER